MLLSSRVKEPTGLTIASRGIGKVQKRPGFQEVLTLEELVNDLVEWKDSNYHALIENRRLWANELSDALLHV